MSQRYSPSPTHPVETLSNRLSSIIRPKFLHHSARDAKKGVTDEEDWYLPYNGPVEQPKRTPERGRNPHQRPLYTDISLESNHRSPQSSMSGKIGPSFLSLDTGGIGESPISTAPARHQTQHSPVEKGRRHTNADAHPRFVFPPAPAASVARLRANTAMQPNSAQSYSPTNYFFDYQQQSPAHHPYGPMGSYIPSASQAFATQHQPQLSQSSHSQSLRKRAMTASADNLYNLATDREVQSSPLRRQDSSSSTHPYALASSPTSRPIPLASNTHQHNAHSNGSSSQLIQPTQRAASAAGMQTRHLVTPPPSRHVQTTLHPPPHTLKLSASTPELQAAARRQQQQRSTNGSHLGLGMGVQAATICDAFLFPRPRFRAVPVTVGTGGETSPLFGGLGAAGERMSMTDSARCFPVISLFGKGSRKGKSKSRSPGRRLEVETEKEKEQYVVQEREEQEKASVRERKPSSKHRQLPPFQAPPPLSHPEAQDRTDPPSPTPTAEAVRLLRANEQFTAEREEWARQAQSSFANSRSRSAVRSIKRPTGTGPRARSAGAGASRSAAGGSMKTHSHSGSKDSNGTDPSANGGASLGRNGTLRYLQAQAFAQGGPRHLSKPSVDSTGRAKSSRSNSRSKRHARTNSGANSGTTHSRNGSVGVIGGGGGIMANGGSSARTSESWGRAANAVKKAVGNVCGDDEMASSPEHAKASPLVEVIHITPGYGEKERKEVTYVLPELGRYEEGEPGIGLALSMSPSPTPPPQPPVVFASHPFNARGYTPPPPPPPQLQTQQGSPQRPLVPPSPIRAGPHPTSPTMQAAILHRAAGSGDFARHRLPIPPPSNLSHPYLPDSNSPSPHPFSLSPEPEDEAQGVRTKNSRYRPSSGLVEAAFDEQLLASASHSSPFEFEGLPSEWRLWEGADEVRRKDEDRATNGTRQRRSNTVNSHGATPPLSASTSRPGTATHSPSPATRSRAPSPPLFQDVFVPRSTAALSLRPKNSSPSLRSAPQDTSPFKSRRHGKIAAVDPEERIVDLNASTSSSTYLRHKTSAPLPLFQMAVPPPVIKRPAPILVEEPKTPAPTRPAPSRELSNHSNGHISQSSIHSSSQSPASIESSPKMSPRPLGGLDDLEMFRDLFYKRPSPRSTPPDTAGNASAFTANGDPASSPIDLGARSSLSEMRRSGLASLRSSGTSGSGSGVLGLSAGDISSRWDSSFPGLGDVQEDEKELEPSIASSHSHETSDLDRDTDGELHSVAINAVSNIFSR